MKHVFSKVFSAEQKFPFMIGIVGIIVYILVIPLVLYVEHYRNDVEILSKTHILFLAFMIFLIVLTGFYCKWFSISFGKVALSDEGISILGFRNKVKRFLRWDEIKLYHVSMIPQVENYICLSTDENIPLRYSCYPALGWTMFRNKHSISMVADFKLIALLDKYIKSEKQFVGRYRATPEEEKNLFKRYWWFALCTLFVLFLTCIVVLLQKA